MRIPKPYLTGVSMTFNQKVSLLSKASEPGRDWISGWRILCTYEVSTKEGAQEKVFVRNLIRPTERRPDVNEDCEYEFAAYWNANTQEWLLENTNN